jgi:group I intron endonuclease
MNSGIYKITHRDTGRVYIGQSVNLFRRFKGYKNHGGSGNGNSVIKRALLKYGHEAFDFEVIVYAEGFDYLNDIEIKLISLYDCMVPKGFNVESGGFNAPCPESTRLAVSKANKGRKPSEEAKQKMSESQKKRWLNISEEDLNKAKEQARNINLGKKMSEETKKKLSETRKKLISEGKIGVLNRLGTKHSEETKLKMKTAHTGKKRTPEQKEKMRQAAIQRWQNPDYRKKVLISKGSI